jgi:hypothetical protein
MLNLKFKSLGNQQFTRNFFGVKKIRVISEIRQNLWLKIRT